MPVSTPLPTHREGERKQEWGKSALFAYTRDKGKLAPQLGASLDVLEQNSEGFLSVGISRRNCIKKDGAAPLALKNAQQSKWVCHEERAWTKDSF